jgi:hypothetical protein
MTKPIDIIMWIGEDNYSVSEFIEEAKTMGVSKRIPANSIPEGIVPGRSRLLIKHRKAIVHGEGLDMLIEDLNTIYAFPEYELPDGMLHLVMTLEGIKEENPTRWKKWVERHNITWHPGVIGYTYITSVQYVVKENEEGLPEELAHMDHLIEPVKLEYAEEEWCRPAQWSEDR